MNRRGFLAAAAAFALSACGGGGGGGSSPPPYTPPPTTLRDDLYYGYYASRKGQLAETADHINLYFSTAWGYDGQDWMTVVVNEFMDAKARGINALMLDLQTAWQPDRVVAEASVRFIFASLRNAGLLSSLLVAYPLDEPDIEAHGPKTDAQVKEVNAMIRRVAAEFPEATNLKLAVIYGGSDPYYPGISSYDWVGVDDYDSGASVLGGIYDQLWRAMRPDQKLILVPGAAFGQDVTQFFNRAQTDQRVALLMPFIWHDNWDNAGNPGGKPGLKSANPALKCGYIEAGKKIKHPHVLTPTCV